MVNVAWNNLWHDKVKSLLSIMGVVISVFLVFTIYGVYNGINSVMEEIVVGTGADIWITQKGTSGSLHSPSILSSDYKKKVSEISGVEEVGLLIRTGVSKPKAAGGNTLIYLNGYETDGSLGAPWKIAEGNPVPDRGEIILDKAFAKSNGVRIGDNLTLRGINFRVKGLSDRGNIMVGYLAFLRYEDAEMFLRPGLANAILVKVRPDSDLNVVRGTIAQRFPEVNVQMSNEIVRAYREEVVGSFIPILLVLSAVAIAAGILVIALLLYMLTQEKRREYGIIKAIGGTNRYLYRVVLGQALIIAASGYALGVGISFPLITIIQRSIPEFLAILSPDLILWGIPIFVATGVLASVIPIRRITTIDPALVFKS